MSKSLSDDAGAAKPTSWWHWILLYPAVFGALVAAIPTVIQEVKAWRLGVTASRVHIVEEQQRLWQRNLDCLHLKPVYTVDVGDGVTVGVTLCGSGDALLRYQRSPDAVSYTWIPYPAYPQATTPPSSTIDNVLPPQSHVMYGMTRCVSLQELLVLWIQYDAEASETCHMDYIATISGAQIQRRPVPCHMCNGES